MSLVGLIFIVLLGAMSAFLRGGDFVDANLLSGSIMFSKAKVQGDNQGSQLPKRVSFLHFFINCLVDHLIRVLMVIMVMIVLGSLGLLGFIRVISVIRIIGL